MNDLNWALVCAAADDPAIATWTGAAATVGAPPPRVVPWADVLDGTAAFRAGEIVHAERLTPVTPPVYGLSRERYDRFAAAVNRLQDRIAADAATATADAAETLLALDRQRCTAHLASAGVSVPTAGGPFVRQRFAEPDDVISELGDRIKTMLKLVRTRSGFELHHSLRLHYYIRKAGGEGFGREGDVVRDLIARDEDAFAVADLPTAYVNNAPYRFRFAVIAGRVTHAAGVLAETRPAREYYGGRRREIDAYRERFGAEGLQRLIELAEQAAAAFPGLPAIGVGIAASQIKRKGPDLVYDIDPFGARLPAALGLRGTACEGLTVPAATLRSWMTR